MEVSISSHYDRPKRIKEALKKGKLLYRFDGCAQTEQRPADVSVTASPENSQGMNGSSPNGTSTDTTINPMDMGGDTARSQNDVSGRKDTQSLTEKQISGEESSLQASDGEGVKSVESKSCYLFGYFTGSLNELIGKVFKDL